MILDTLADAAPYEGMHPSFPAAFEWLRNLDPSLPDGRYEIGGPGLVAIVQRYETAPSELKKWETHRVHGDIQYMIAGAERVGYDRREKLSVKTPYNPEKDAEFYEPPAGASSGFLLEAGSFAVFYPHDAHQPGVMTGTPAPVHKVVVKFTL